MAIRLGLIGEVVVMALDTVRTNKMRSGLTVLGVVIGITSIVGMTALIRGFDQSLRDMIRAIGPNTIFVQRFGVTSFASGTELKDLLKRPNLTVSDSRAIEEQAGDAIQLVDIELGAGGPPTQERVFYRDQKTKPLVVFGTTRELRRRDAHPDRGRAVLQRHRGPVPQERRRARQHRRTSCCSSRPASIRSASSSASAASGSRWSACSTSGPAAGGFNLGQDDFVVIPYTAYQRIFGLKAVRISRDAHASCRSRSRCVPRDGVSQADAMAEVERVMRIRHGLRLDEPDDFDLVTQDAFLKLWDQISQGTFFALVVISSIALMVGGIGVMAIMSISVTERTREIGVRKALGARRAEILFQFLMEAAFLTSLGGVLGVLLGAAIGMERPLHLGLPGLAAVVVVRHRPRLLRLGRHLLRDVSRLQGLAPGSDRSAALRVVGERAALAGRPARRYDAR